MIDILTFEPFLPSTDRLKGADAKVLAEYQIEFARSIHDYLKQVVASINLQLQLVNVGIFNFDLPDGDGVFSEGAVRLIKVSGGAIELQEHDGTDWRSGDDATAIWDY